MSEWWREAIEKATCFEDIVMVFRELFPNEVRRPHLSLIGKTDEEKKRFIKGFVRDVLMHETDNTGLLVIETADHLKQSKVLEETGVDIGSPQEILLPSRVIHVRNRHPELTEDDWANILDIMRNFDKSYRGLEIGKDKGERIIFTKAGEPKETVYIVELFRGKNRGDRLQVVSYFKDDENSVKGWLKNHTREKKQ